jgi:aminoglycoside phosphotransferase (APT) family kinase protein
MIPPAEVEVDETLVYQLLHEQHSDLAHLPLQFVKNGWDNFLFRLGDELAVRIPRREMSAGLIRNEQQFLPLIAPRLPLPVTQPLRIGSPGCGYPWYWSICPWLHGTTADLSPPDMTTTRQWAAFLAALHIPGPNNGPHNPYRGNPLATYCERFDERFQRLRDKQLINSEAVNAIWQRGLDADPGFIPCWGHGDLHTMNILCEGGKFTGVIDWGDIYIGDVAGDLGSYYILFPEPIADRSLQHEYHASTAQIARAKACAMFIAVILLDTGIDENPQQVAIARKTFGHFGLL